MKIIFFDLETLPDMDQAFEVWPSIGDFPGRTFKATINSIICFGYRVYDPKSKRATKAKVKCAWDFPAWKQNVNDDKEICKVVYETLKDANYVITQNGKKFDWKFVQTRLMVHGLPPLPTIPHIDLKVLASRNLLMYSNSLKELAKLLTTDRKMENEGWPLWSKTRQRDPKAMKIMATYCKQDVDVMVPIYERLRPFVKELNFNIDRRDGVDRCPTCGGFDHKREGTRYTKTRSYVRLQCKDCLSWFIGGEQVRMPKPL